MAQVKPYIEEVKQDPQPNGTWENPYSLEAMIRANTGKRIPDVEWTAEQLRRATLKEQTEDFCRKLEAEGIKTKTENDITFLGLVSGVKKRQKARYRNINILPLVAQENRAKLKSELAYFLNTHPHARYMVITNGQRIPAFDDLQGNMKRFSRKISRWAFEVRQMFGIELFVRTFEFPRNAAGTYHLHANIVFEPRHRLTKKRWREFKDFTDGYFKTIIKDAGEIKNINEIVKYVTKPESLLGAEASELAWLVNETFNKRMFSAFGEFARFRRTLRESDKKIVPHEGSLTLMRKENFRSQNDDEQSEEEPSNRDVSNQLLTIIPPCNMISPFKEPVAVIRNFKSHSVTNQVLDSYVDLMHPNEPTKFTMMRDAAIEAWHQNGAPDPSTAIAFAKTLAETQDVNKVEFLSQKKAEVEERSQLIATYRDIVEDAEEAAADDIGFNKNIISVSRRDKEKAENEIIREERQRIAEETVKKVTQKTAQIIRFSNDV